MNIGMLWFDNDPKTELTVKVERAADYFRTKYGKTPTLCMVHPSMLPAQPRLASKDASSEANPTPILKSAGIEIRPNRSVLPNHFWIGVNASPS